MPNLATEVGNGPPSLPPGPQTPGGNKLNPSNTMSLYQKAILIRERWRRVPGFQESFLDTEVPHAGAEPDTILPSDPVIIVLTCLRIGASLCFLFNALNLERQLEIQDIRPQSVSGCKRATAHFLMACKKELGWSDDQLFTVSQLYEPNTTGSVKVRHPTVLSSLFYLLMSLQMPPGHGLPVRALSITRESRRSIGAAR